MGNFITSKGAPYPCNYFYQPTRTQWENFLMDMRVVPLPGRLNLDPILWFVWRYPTVELGNWMVNAFLNPATIFKTNKDAMGIFHN